MCSKGYLFLSSNNIKPRILTSRPQALLHQVKLHFSRAECTKQANLTPINDFQASAKEDRTPLSLTHTQQIIPVTKIWTTLNANNLLNDNVSQVAARLLELLIKHRSVSGVTASPWMCGACRAVVMTENSLPAQEPFITPVSVVVSLSGPRQHKCPVIIWSISSIIK